MCPDVPHKRLLLIDDDPAMIPRVDAALGDAFDEIESVSSYDAGIAAIRKQHYDVCLLSSRIEGRSTIDLLRQAVSECSDMPVIVFTPDVGDTDHEAMLAGAADTLAKLHLNPRLLSRTVRHAIERCQWQAKREQSAAKLARANTELQRFAYVASHDLQEPLRVITGYLQILQRRYFHILDESGQMFVQQALQASGRMRQLILDLLSYARVGADEKPAEPANAMQVLDQVLHDLQAQIKDRGATITYDKLPQVLADTTQLSQLLQNLINNAIKFVKDRPPCVHLSAEPHEEGWLFCVCDNGIGIEPEMSERVFEVFRRLHSRDQYPGSGIGLAVCKHIVERHGGHIWVESQPGEGSAFYFTLPAAPEVKEETHASIAA